jgi:hypothetical protein
MIGRRGWRWLAVLATIAIAVAGVALFRTGSGTTGESSRQGFGVWEGGVVRVAITTTLR